MTVVYSETDFILWVGGLYIVVDDFFENSLIGFIAAGILVAIVYGMILCLIVLVLDALGTLLGAVLSVDLVGFW